MGKQTLVALTEQDEIHFLEFLHSTGDIKIFRPLAPDAESFELEAFLPLQEGHWQFFIWPTRFPWRPIIRRIPDDAPAVGRRGWHYILCSGPIMEYSRHNFSAEFGFGRVYWNRYFMQRQHIPYDDKAFSSWYAEVLHWLRTNGSRKSDPPHSTYYLPDAWARYGKN